MTDTTPVKSLTEFLKRIEALKEGDTKYYYRGAGQKFESTEYTPSLLRDGNKSLIKNDYEEDYLNKFYNLHPEYNSSSNFERLAIAQHNGLKTRLLDISENPLVSLYFAVENDSNEKNAIFYMFTNKNNKLKNSNSDTAQLLATLSFMNSDDRNKLIENTVNFVNDIESLIYSALNEPVNTSLKVEIYKALYAKYTNKAPIKFEPLDEKNFEPLYAAFKKDLDTLFKTFEYQSFYHTAGTYRGAQYDEIFDVRDLFIPHFLVPPVVDEKIKHQKGLFIHVPFSNKTFLAEKVLEYHNVEKINCICKPKPICKKRFIKNLFNPFKPSCTCVAMVESASLVFNIDGGSKKIIKKELENIGIDKAFVYPDMKDQADFINKMY
ncbi:FRG domain-containing protein [Periweissella ghanensis]|uniref:FRG domain-containing protein n=1 Tax=Periweissella ghanensis TaxID=467997 RepID=A0ABN8BSY9_9LACO|nr:FRG domain-containing protein [Periweissella ghanensis]MCM0601263.1 FRG domain-containing protein [Periweissella ghanensis]CAH0419337.1 hypothetical protein WGH24286_01787 [Periweissella ghanensis]